LTERLTEIPTFEERGMRECARFLSEELEAVGFSTRLDRLNNVFATKVFPHGNGTFLINTHFDTISYSSSWTRDPLKAALEGDRLYGLGVSDAKGGIAGTLYVLGNLEDCRFRKLEILFSNYEDNNTVVDGRTVLGTPYFLEQNRLESKYGLNVEGTVKDGKFMLSIGCGGRVGFHVTTIGKEAHSSDPRMGRNAIYDMMRVIEALHRVPPARMTFNGYEAYTELNVNMISGGRAINIVPGECTIVCERRVLPNEEWEDVKKEVEATLSSIKDIDLKVQFLNPQRAYLLDKGHEIVRLVRESVEETLHYSPQLKVESGRTDSTYLDEMAGVKTVILGPGEEAHIPDEYINVRRLEEFTMILHHMLSRRR